MGVVNRCAIGVRARSPMRAWAHAMEPEAPLIDDLEPSLYLIPLQDQDRLPEERLREHFMPIFQEELRCWCEDPSLWPQPLTLELFLLWVRCALLRPDRRSPHGGPLRISTHSRRTPAA